MDIKLVELLLRVADHGSISKAALELHMTQPALSRRIAALEHQVGAALLTRNSRGAALTEAGELLAERARPIMRQIDVLADEIGQRNSAQVSLGLPFSMQRIVTAPFFAEQIRTSGRDHSLRIYEGFNHTLREWMSQSLIDVCIMDYRDTTAPELTQTPLLREQMLLVGDEQSGLSLDAPVGAESLGDVGLILPGRPNVIRVKTEAFMSRHGVSYQRAAEAETLSLCLELTRRGVGQTVLPYCALYDYPSLQHLRAAPVKGLMLTWSMYTAKAREHSIAVRRMAAALRSFVLDEVNCRRWPFTELVGATAPASEG